MARATQAQTEAVEELERLSAEQTARLPEQDAALTQDIINAWSARRLGGLRHHQKSVRRDVSILFDFMRFSQCAPWYWDEDLFERWCYELGVIRTLAIATQRHYQSAIRNFLDYAANNIRFRNEVRQKYGMELRQICTEDNCIPHKVDREMSVERRALTHEEIQTLFDAIDRAIKEAHRFSSKDFRPLQRDKAMFSVIYMAGLRISEARGLDIRSFQPNPNIPEFGPYGYVSVFGKGSRGSGPKHRLVPVTHTGLPAVLTWYIEKVRPWFLQNADPNEEGLFLSERGKLIAVSTMEARFQHALAIANLEGMNLTPHSLRHSSVTHESLRMSLEANRRKHGHVFAATTQGYTHIGDDFVQEEVDRIVNDQIEGALASKKKRENPDHD